MRVALNFWQKNIFFEVLEFDLPYLLNLVDDFFEKCLEVRKISLISYQILYKKLNLIVWVGFFWLIVFENTCVKLIPRFSSEFFNLPYSVVEYGVGVFLRIIIVIEKFIEIFIVSKEIKCHQFVKEVSHFSLF